MLLDTEIRSGGPSAEPDVFDVFNEAYRRHRPTEEERRIYGNYALRDAVILETPADVLASGEVLTNPSIIVDGFAYFRREPTSFHLGKTTSVPYRLLRNKQGGIYLSEFAEAIVLPGEDPRVMRNIKIAGLNGKIHNGWCVSTVVATAMPNNPADVQGIKQVFYWGEKLSELEPILEIPDLKNTNVFPLSEISGDDTDTRFDVFGRPHPHISYTRVLGLMSITKELIESSALITEGFLPSDIHVGVNNVKAVLGYPDLRELDIHEACAPITPKGKILNYRLGRYGYNLSTGLITPLGVLASREDFPETDEKPPENGVGSYKKVLYGSMGDPQVGMMLTGVSDRQVGLAQIVRVNK